MILLILLVIQSGHGEFVMDTDKLNKLAGRKLDDVQGLIPDGDVGNIGGSRCKLNVSSYSVERFRHAVYYYDLSYVFLNLTFSSNITFKESRKVVEPNIWVWTYYGKNGGVEFLSWPIEFGLWSMGLLNSFVYGPININVVYVSGNCSALGIGEVDTDLAISNSLKSLANSMMVFDEERYGPSFWCYKRRIFINPPMLYSFCLHVACPLEALEYVCCSYVFEKRYNQRKVSCKEPHKKLVFRYDSLWWVGPIIIACILMTFSPLPFLWMFGKLGKRKDTIRNANNCENAQGEFENEEVFPVIYLNGTFPITFLSTVFMPCTELCNKRGAITSRLIRATLPFLSMIVIGFQIVLDYIYLHEFVMDSLQKGVPLGFRSMGAGYEMSRKKFLSYLGGPFVACGLYITITVAFLSCPKSLAHTLQAGLSNHERPMSGLSPLRLNFVVLEHFGSVSVSSRHGYCKVFSVHVAQFFMLINKNFWVFIFNLQVDRLKASVSMNWLRYVVSLPYIVVCVLEVLLCLLIYGSPLISFILTIIRGYRRGLYETVQGGGFGRLVGHSIAFFLIFAGIFLIFMFSTIFLDAFLFVSRVATFTYTGIVIYPRVSYGYLIFAFTVVFYLWDAINTFNQSYEWLLKIAIRSCLSLQETEDQILVYTKDKCQGIRQDVFEYIIEHNMPRRKHVFISLMKVCIILTILGVSLHLLTSTASFRELHVIMHAGVALFICAFPKLLKSMCYSKHDKRRYIRGLREVKTSVHEFLAITDDPSSSHYDMD